MNESNMKTRDLTVDEKLALVTFRPSGEPHITVDSARCRTCPSGRVCEDICPAQNYRWDEHAERMTISTESCFECGSCRIVCTEHAITWSWPTGGFGIAYAHG